MRPARTHLALLLATALSVLATSALGTEPADDDEKPIEQVLFEEKLKRASAGDSEAMESLAFSYEYGIGTDRNETEAIRWLERSAAKGSHTAESGLGDIFGGKKEYERSFFWYSKAAKSKHPWALFRLGVMYQKGWHVHRDATVARQHLEEAATLGSADAQHYVGMLYFQGNIFPKNRIAAYAWLSKAAAKDQRFVETRDRIEASLSASELLSAQQLTLELDKAGTK